MPAPETAPTALTDVPPEAEALSQQLRSSLTRIMRRMRLERSSEQISNGQYGVLGVLARLGPLSPGALAEQECVQPPAMTRALNALEEAGLVRRDPHPTDGRQVLVSVTDRGRAEVTETRRRRDDWMSARLAELSAQDYATLERAATVLERIARG